jgi:hypothetical protein
MGYNIILTCTCTIKPEFINFINRDYFCLDYPIENIPEEFHTLVNHWRHVGLENFRQFDLSDNEFTFEICKKVTTYPGNLERAYTYILKYVIVPITSYISDCLIEHDDYSCAIYVLNDKCIRENNEGFYEHAYIYSYRVN